MPSSRACPGLYLLLTQLPAGPQGMTLGSLHSGVPATTMWENQMELPVSGFGLSPP